MGFDWRDLLPLAKTLQENCPSGITPEAAYRTAINRAYYAVYGHSVRFAIEKYSYTPQGSAKDHSGVRRHFQRTRSRQLSIMLEKLYENREKSDYEAIVPDLSHLAKESVDLAQQALIFIESFWRPSSPP
ncbi:MAG TPA: hypothetical protein PKD57_14770 [Saprospiraceae bacterium]|nr:hypothetical protein [Saprospiraceae bacterium]HNB70267.1 hypothetical protein [Acidobacteriota bacterium]